MKRLLIGGLLLLGLLYSFSGSTELKQTAKVETKLTAFPEYYQKRRLIITTDIGGGDEDDIQSMIHFLVYANMFDLEGIVISRPGGHISAMRKVVSAYRKDYNKFLFVSPDYPSPGELLRLTKVGAKRYGKTPAQGWSKPTAGSKLIVKQARKIDDRPLYVLAWGSTTDIAQAVYDAPDIKKKLIVYGIGTNSYNYWGDEAPTDYLRKQKDLFFIDNDTTFRGIYLWGQNGKDKYGNVGFVSKVIKKRGALGRLFYRISADINVNSYGIKMGDTPSLLFVMNGDIENPRRPSWGGAFCKKTRKRFVDCKNPNLKIGSYFGAKTVGIHRVDFLKDWERRLKIIYDHDQS